MQLIDTGMAAAIKDDFVPRFQTYVTQPYRPPELWNCSGPIAKFLAVGVDLWSFGCVVCGHWLFFDGRSNMKKLGKQQRFENNN